jgi:hypothetical protein
MPREIITDWVTPAGSGFASVMYFDPATAVATQRAALGAFFGTVDADLNNQVNWTVRNDGRELDDATGTLTGNWNTAVNQTGTGAGTVDAVPDASQVLFRWSTGDIVNGRLVKGRTFVPGLEISALADGNLDPAFFSGLNGACTTLAASGAGFQIWHRPIAGSGGSAHAVLSGVVWAELAVLRQRRQ